MDILLVGGGHAHIAALRALSKAPLHDATLSLVTPNPTTLYSGMLPGYMAGHWSRQAIELDINRICKNAGTKIHFGRIETINPEKGVAVDHTGIEYHFDIVSIDIGRNGRSISPLELHQNTVASKPLERLLDKWEAYRDHVTQEKIRPSVAIIGAGLAGIEIAFAVHHAFRDRGPHISILERSSVFMREGPAALRNKLRRQLASQHISLIFDAEISCSNDQQLVLSDNRTVQADFVIVATGGVGWLWLQASALDTDDGLINVNEHLQSTSHPNVFAAGDVANFVKSPLPPAGLYAIRQGEMLARTFHALTTRKPLPVFKPQQDYLKLVTLGDRKAIAEKWGAAISLPGLWELKRMIDETHMKKDR